MLKRLQSLLHKVNPFSPRESEFFGKNGLE